VVLQASRSECGLACLAMVLDHHGCHVPMQELRAQCPTGRDGLSAGVLLRTAQQFGMTAKGYKATPQALAQLPVPVIAHWGSDHFVVIERVTSRAADVVDPRLGRRRLPIDDAHAGLGKVLLSLQPGEGFTARRRQEKPFWYRYLRTLTSLPGTGRLLAQILAVTVITQLLVAVMPFATKIVVDESTSLRASSLFTLLGAGLAVAAVAQLLTGLLRAALLVKLQGRLDTHALLGVLAHLMRLPLRYFEQRSTGDIITRFGTIALLRDMMTSQSLGSLLDAVLVLTYLVLLFFVDLTVALALLAIVAAVVVLLWATTRAVRERMALDLATQAESQGNLVEMIEGITTIKASAAETRALDRQSDLLFSWITVTLRRSYLGASIEAVTTALRFSTPLLVLWLCVTRVLDGTLTPGAMLAVTWLATAIITPLASVAASGQRLQLVGAQLQRLSDLLETPPEHTLDEPEPAVPLRGSIALEAVGFRYDPHSSPVLHDITTTIPAGRRVAIVGSTGSGKTTLGMILLGLYPSTSGTIRYDDQPPGAIDLRSLRSQVGVVLQDPFLFSGTIRDNIAMHDPSVPQEDIVHAAKVACLHEEIMAMPLGYATRLAQRGIGMSGGQRQRLALARALVRRPALLLLDEATSHLDAATEARVHHNLAELHCTQIIIAHRLSTVRDADQILVLDQGRLAEAGNHHDLLTRNTHYAALVTGQLDISSPDGTARSNPVPTTDTGRR